MENEDKDQTPISYEQGVELLKQYKLLLVSIHSELQEIADDMYERLEPAMELIEKTYYITRKKNDTKRKKEVKE